MNINQNSGVPSAQSPSKDQKLSASINSPKGLDFEAFSNQLLMAKSKTDWFASQTSKEEKQRVYDDRLNEIREEDDQKDKVSEMNFFQHSQTKADADLSFVDEQLEHRKGHLRVPTIDEAKNKNQADAIGLEDLAKSGKTDQKKDGALSSVAKETSFKELLEPRADLKPSRESQTDHQKSLLDQKLVAIDSQKLLQRKESGAIKLNQISAEPTNSRFALNENQGAAQKKNPSPPNRGISGLAKTFDVSENVKFTSEKATLARAEKPSDTISMKEVQNNVRYMVSNDKSEMTIRLVPAHLGRLEIKLKKEGDKLIGKLKVENNEAKKALESQLSTLKEGLENQGVRIETFFIMVQDEKSPNRSSGSADRQTSQNKPSIGTPRSDVSTDGKEKTAQSSRSASDLNVYI